MLWLSEVQAVCAKRTIKLTVGQLKFVLQMAQQCDSACEVEALIVDATDSDEPSMNCEVYAMPYRQLLAVA